VSRTSKQRATFIDMGTSTST